MERLWLIGGWIIEVLLYNSTTFFPVLIDFKHCCCSCIVVVCFQEWITLFFYIITLLLLYIHIYLNLVKVCTIGLWEVNELFFFLTRLKGKVNNWFPFFFFFFKFCFLGWNSYTAVLHSVNMFIFRYQYDVSIYLYLISLISHICDVKI